MNHTKSEGSISSVFYKPPDAWAADFIPFYWSGVYHLFYLKDYRDIATHGEGTPWFHLTTSDCVHFIDHGEVLPRGGIAEQDLYVFTGSVIAAQGGFHIYYTGHNPHLRQQGRPEQGVMHAVSPDLYTWQKVPEETFFAPIPAYEPHDWRDPFVFWNAQAGEYWMLLAARLPDGPSRRRGCTALCTSTNLQSWRVRNPLYAPGLYYTHECPDLFQMGDWWYLIFSEFSEAHVTRYRMSHALDGPWQTPEVDTFDGRAFYAARTASDGERRMLFGWNPTRRDEVDNGQWQWGGNLVVHQLVQNADGSLGVCPPDRLESYFTNPVPVEFRAGLGGYAQVGDSLVIDSPAGFSCASAGVEPSTFLVKAHLSFDAGTHNLGLMLRSSPDFERGYYLRLEPARNRLVFDSWPRPGDRPFLAELERPLTLSAGKPIELVLVVTGSVCEVYLQGQVALNCRLYDHANGEWGFFVSNGRARFSKVRLYESK